MADINLHMSTTTNVTYVSNAFIDYYMKDANGEFVKIYLYLLRALSQNNMDFSIAAMADALGHTQLLHTGRAVAFFRCAAIQQERSAIYA